MSSSVLVVSHGTTDVSLLGLFSVVVVVVFSLFGAAIAELNFFSVPACQ